MSLRLATANENRSEREGTTSVVPRQGKTETGFSPEGFEAGPSEAKASCRLRFFGTTEVVPSRTHQSSKSIFS